MRGRREEFLKISLSEEMMTPCRRERERERERETPDAEFVFNSMTEGE